jgi:hypothetical protein
MPTMQSADIVQTSKQISVNLEKFKKIQINRKIALKINRMAEVAPQTSLEDLPDEVSALKSNFRINLPE